MSSEQPKALVVSGGGARGAWGVGVCKALIIAKSNEYQCLVGTSTGSLMGALVLTKEFDKLEEAYTSVTQKSIFNVNPFNKKGGINGFKAACRIIAKKETLGESKPLRENLIPKFLTQATFDKIRQEGKEFVATVTSLTNNEVAYKSTKEIEYNDMLDWIWASANQGVYMSNLCKDGEVWVDGGVKDYLPITQAINLGAKHIDIIVHNTEELLSKGWQQDGGPLKLLLRVISVLTVDVAEDNISESKLRVDIDEDITLSFYYMSQDLVNQTRNPLVFKKDVMKNILQKGYESVLDGSIIRQDYRVDTKGVMHKVKHV